MATTRRRVDAPLVQITVKVSPAMKKAIEKAAAADGVTTALIVRGCIERGLTLEVKARNNARQLRQKREKS